MPFLQNLFDTFALSAFDWLVVGLAAFTVVPVLELAKFLERREVFGKLDQLARRRATPRGGGGDDAGRVVHPPTPAAIRR